MKPQVNRRSPQWRIAQSTAGYLAKQVCPSLRHSLELVEWPDFSTTNFDERAVEYKLTVKLRAAHTDANDTKAVQS